jgi:hypothetical protein
MKHDKHAKELALIRSRIEDTRAVIAKLKQNEQEHLVGSAAGNQASIKAIDDLRRAERELADLLVAEPIAIARVQEDEARAAALAAKVKARQFIYQRIDDAQELRRLLQAAQACYDAYMEKGRTLLNLLPPTGHGAFSQAENLLGRSRAMPELPKMFFELIPNAASFLPSPKYSMPLEQSERLVWAQFLDETEKAA